MDEKFKNLIGRLKKATTKEEIIKFLIEQIVKKINE